MTLVVGKDAVLREAQYAAEKANEEAKLADQLAERKYVDESASAALRSIAWSLREMSWHHRAESEK